MKRWAWACLLAGCAGSAPEPDPEPAPSAPAVSTSASTGEREARQEVLQAEAERKADAFRSRLARLRAEEEARAKARAEAERKARTGTAAMARTLASLTTRQPMAPTEPDPGAEVGLEPAETPPLGTSVGPRPGDPTPEAWLRASRCLEAQELVAVQKRMAEARHAGKPRQVQAQWALALVETQGLLDDVEAELAHRGLANQDPSCAAPNSAVDLLRPLYGRGARGGFQATEVIRGAQRLRTQLEIRAGLPRPTYEP